MKTNEIMEIVKGRFAGVDESTTIFYQSPNLTVYFRHDRGSTEFNAKLYQVGNQMFVADYDEKNNILAWWGVVEMGIEEEVSDDDSE